MAEPNKVTRKRISLIQPEETKEPESFFERAARFDDEDDYQANDSTISSSGFFSQVLVSNEASEKTLVCQVCGAILNSNAKFCTECGSAVNITNGSASIQKLPEDEPEESVQAESSVMSTTQELEIVAEPRVEPESAKESMCEPELTQEPMCEPESAKESMCEPESVAVDDTVCVQPIKSILDKLDNACCVYNDSKNLDFDDLKINYEDGVPDVRIENRAILLPIRKVFIDGTEIKFNSVGEANVPEGKDIEVDFGIKLLSPNSIKVILCELEDTEKKFGLQLISEPVLNKQECMFRVTAVFRARDNIAYMNKFKSIAALKIVRA